MKPILLFVAFYFFCLLNLKAQKVQFAKISDFGQELNNIPRFSWSIPVRGKLFRLSNKLIGVGGLVLKNEGIIYKRGEDKYKHRTIAFSPEAGLSYLFINKCVVTISVGVDYNFHYKEMFFNNGVRQNKVIVESKWNSTKVNIINPYGRIMIGSKRGIGIFYEQYFSTYLNQNFKENVNGINTMPFKHLFVRRFNIGISASYWPSTGVKELNFD